MIYKFCHFVIRHLWLVLAVLCVCAGYYMFSKKPQAAGSLAETKIEKILENCDNETRNKIEAMRVKVSDTALAATLKERYQCDKIDGLKRLAEGRDDFDLKLAQMAVDKKMTTMSEAAREERDGFFMAHCAVWEKNGILSEKQEFSEFAETLRDNSAAYRTQLEEAAKNDEDWYRVRENPMMVFIMMNVKNRDLLKFYDAEKDWLDDVLAVVLMNSAAEYETEDGTRETSEPFSIEEILTVASENHPYFRDALKDSLDFNQPIEDEVLTVFSLFANNGEVIRYCVNEGHIALDELLNVLFANPGFSERNKHLTPEAFAAKLIRIKTDMPKVWELAPIDPFCLGLAEDVPTLANSLCEKFPGYDLGTFLYTFYPNELSQAASAIDKFGELAIAMMTRYEPSNLFHEHLLKNDIGVRIIPYVARFENSGLERLDENRAWLDKYFDAEGNAIGEPWWTSIPGGSAVNVAKNWATGVPCEWSELGWAALDVGDAALLVCSFGSSAGLSVAKGGASSAVKQTVKTSVKTSIKTAGKRTVTREGEKVVAARSGRLTALRKTLAKKAEKGFALVKKGTGKVGSSLLVRGVKAAGKSVSSTLRGTYRAWKSVPIKTRKLLYRAALVVNLSIILSSRTLPMLQENLPEAMEEIGRILVEIPKTAAESAGAVLAGAFNELLIPVMESIGPRGNIMLGFGFVLIALALAFVEYKRWQSRRLCA